jgi:aminocarboxymuconate-semialdehyde decarboxylase
MSKIDAFCHVMPAEYATRLEGIVDDAPAAANLIKRIYGIPSMIDLDLRFSHMDEFGEDYRQVISLPAPPPEDLGPHGVDMARLGNDGLAGLVADHPDRFCGWVAAVPMNDVDATLEEIDRACGELGALGVQIYTHVNGHPLDEERFEPFWARMAALGKPVWVHPSRNASWADYPSEDYSRYEIWWVFGWEYDTAAFMARLVFSGVLERHPELKILIHHGGSMIPHFAGRVGPGWDQLGARTPADLQHQIEGPQLSKRPIEYFKMFYADTAMFGAAHAIQCSLEFFGADRMLFASDTPFDPEKGPAYIRSTIANLESLELSDVDKEKIYSGNARRVLGVT